MFEFLTNRFSSLFDSLRDKGVITEQTLQETVEKIHDTLLEADIPYELVQTFIEDLKKEVVGKKIVRTLKPAEQLAKLVHDQLKLFLAGKEEPIPFSFQFPAVVMMMGLQGSGKTTTIAKIAHFIKKQAAQRHKERKILFASVDFSRPAAVDQLEILARTSKNAFYRASSSAPIDAAREIYAYFKKGQFDLLFLDTAGRLHIDNQLLQELREIDAQLIPTYKFLVVDAMTGQESLHVARAFDQAVGFSHAVLTKMDSDTRAGVAFSFRYALGKPIQFVGIGEKLDDLDLFYPDRMAGRILGEGDLLSLAEKADQKIKKSDQEAAYQSLTKGTFTLHDFAQQMDMINKIGSFSTILKYLPGIGASGMSPQALEQGEREMQKMRAMINSMTHKERIQPAILNESRKKRIARGAGVEVAQINNLLQRFEQSKQYVKLLKKFGRFNNVFK